MVWLRVIRVRFPTVMLKQEEGTPTQVKPASCRPSEEQPSPFIVFPSSHSYPPVMIPFPRMVCMQREGRPEQ